MSQSKITHFIYRLISSPYFIMQILHIINLYYYTNIFSNGTIYEASCQWANNCSAGSTMSWNTQVADQTLHLHEQALYNTNQKKASAHMYIFDL